MPIMDVLRALDELKDAGVEERSARAIIRLVSEAVELQAVTKPDLERAALVWSARYAACAGPGLYRALRPPFAGPAAEVAWEIHRCRVEVVRELDVSLKSFTAHLRAALALNLGGTAFLLVLFYGLLR